MHREVGAPSLVEAWLPENLGQNRRLGQLVAGIYAAPRSGGPAIRPC